MRWLCELANFRDDHLQAWRTFDNTQSWQADGLIRCTTHLRSCWGLLVLCPNLRSINLIVRCTLGSQQEVNSCRCLAKLNNLSKATLILDYTTPELHSPSEWMPLGNSVARVLLCNTACDETLVSQFSLQYTNLRSSQLSTNVD